MSDNNDILSYALKRRDACGHKIDAPILITHSLAKRVVALFVKQGVAITVLQNDCCAACAIAFILYEGAAQQFFAINTNARVG